MNTHTRITGRTPPADENHDIIKSSSVEFVMK